jgi:hypothetical protein
MILRSDLQPENVWHAFLLARLEALLAQRKSRRVPKSPRQRMHWWAVRWREEVRRNGRSEVSQTMLDLAVGWREMSVTDTTGPA